MVNLAERRKFKLYVVWSKDITSLWNNTITLYNIIKRISKGEATRRERDLRKELGDLNKQIVGLRINLISSRWIIVEIDPQFIKNIKTHPRYFLSKGMEFETIIVNIILILREAEKELGKKIEKWKEISYTYTFISTGTKGPRRWIEVRLLGQLPLEYSNRLMREFPYITEIAIKIINSDYHEFLYSPTYLSDETTESITDPKTGEQIQFEEIIEGYTGKDIKRPRIPGIALRAYDHDYVRTTLSGEARKDEWWLMNADEIAEFIAMNTSSFLRKKGRIKTKKKQKKLTKGQTRLKKILGGEK